MDKRPEQLASICRVERGVYVFRYVEAGSKPFPEAHFDLKQGDVAFVHAPGREGGVLEAPGQAVVVVASGAGEFEINVRAVGFGGTDAKFSIDLIDSGRPETGQGPNPMASFDAGGRRTEPHRASRVDDDAPDLSIVAHVSRRGDVASLADEWIAGPNEVLPIEGLAISVGRPDLEVRVRVQSTRSGPTWSRWFDAEEFAGSRQEADPLTAIALALTGEAAAKFELAADVMSLGSPPTTKTGRLIEFFGIDPVVGFRLRLNSVKRAAAPPLARPASPLRVFRAKK